MLRVEENHVVYTKSCSYNAKYGIIQVESKKQDDSEEYAVATVLP